MSALKKPIIPRQSSYKSHNVKTPLTDLKHYRSCSEGGDRRNTLGLHLSRTPLTPITTTTAVTDNSNTLNAVVTPNAADPQTVYAGDATNGDNKENNVGAVVKKVDNVFDDKPKRVLDFKSCSTNSAMKLKPTSLQLCMQLHDPHYDSSLSKLWNPIDSENFSSSANVWDYSDSEAAPASSWSTLPNRSLLYRPLPLDIGRCTCIIVKEKSLKGLEGGVVYSLYTNEGKGRQDRKLAVAYHIKRNGKSVFTVAQNPKGVLSTSDDSLIGTVTANLMGSKYHIWDQGTRLSASDKKPKSPLAVVTFTPTIATWTGSYRSMIASIPKHQSMLLKSASQSLDYGRSSVLGSGLPGSTFLQYFQAQHINGLPHDWDGKGSKTQQLFSKAPLYNKLSKQYELDFRDRGRSGLRIQSSVKNFQLTLEKNGRQTILQFGRVEKSKYVMDYRYPLTGYQAFSICLASMDSKLCCTV